MSYKEANEDELELIKFAKDFGKFLERGPKIRYNLHDVLMEISHQFKFIEANI